MSKNLIRAAIVAAAFTGTAYAQQIAVISCDPCNSLADLRAKATWFATYYPATNNTTILVTSLSTHLSAYFHVSIVSIRGRYFLSVASGQATDMDTATLDEAIYARSLKILPITIPAPPTETDDWFDLFLQKELVPTGLTGRGSWGGVTILQDADWWQLQDKQTGQLLQAFAGQIIWVIYNDGSSEQWQFLGVPHIGCPLTGPCQWKRVPNTHMKNGVPVNPPSPPPKPSTPYPNFFKMRGTWQGMEMNVLLSSSWCSGTSSVSVTLPDGSSSPSTGNDFFFPCP